MKKVLSWMEVWFFRQQTQPVYRAVFARSIWIAILIGLLILIISLSLAHYDTEPVMGNK